MAKKKVEIDIQEEKKHIIEELTLIKVETNYSQKTQTYYYNLKISGIDESLIIHSFNKIDNVIGSGISYKLDPNTNEIIDFNFI